MSGPGEKTTAQKMRENLAYLRSKGASKERIQQEIDRWDAELQQESANERKLSRAEKVAAVGSKLGSGATFGLLDEAVGLFNKDAMNEQRFLQKQLEEENPGVALAAEVAGGLAMPGSFLSAPAKLAAGATRAAKLARTAKVAGAVLGEGALQGAAAGIGNAEGSLEERLDEGLKGGAAGAATAGVISGIGRGIGAARKAAAVKRGVHTPTLDELVLATPDEDIATAHRRYAELQARKLGGEATVADVLPQGESALRAQATASQGTRKHVDTTLRDRSTRLANVADDRLSEHTGTQRQSARKTADQLDDEARSAAKPKYDDAEGEALAFEEMPTAQTRAARKQISAAADLPYVREHVARIQKRSQFSGMKPTDHLVLDEAYKDIGYDIRLLKNMEEAKNLSPEQNRQLQDLIQQRRELGEAIVARSPSYRAALDEYAGPMALKDAYARGAKETPADVIPSDLSDLGSSEAKMYREAKAQKMRANVPNADLGELARFSDVMAPVANREKAEVFKATFGEKAYREYLADLLEMAKMQRMKAGAGESTTVDKLIEQMQGNPDLLQIAGELAQGNVGAAVKRGALMGGMDRLLSSKVNADRNANFLLRSGDDVPRTLDEMVGLRAEARRPTRGTVRQLRGRDGGYAGRGVNAASRTAGSLVGRS